ncbi:hypothetical protein [Enterococcus avium]|uniref:hypothetical protein n=1 Tax=Enterococcus avium TaxID=33945 RepID=UPI00288EBDFC|nr:hypothetical protein [Enterococcus avium]MDT2383535.1 hypothetical protein [Enterococcus avium]
MGKAKKEMEEKEDRLEKRDEYLIEYEGYSRCVEHGGLFKSSDKSIICDECWNAKMSKD